MKLSLPLSTPSPGTQLLLPLCLPLPSLPLPSRPLFLSAPLQYILLKEGNGIGPEPDLGMNWLCEDLFLLKLCPLYRGI